MADIVNSLFGLSPQEIRAEKLTANREKSLGLAQLAPQGYGAIVAGAGDIGFALGEGLGSLLGVQDPQLTRAKNIENVLFSVQNELGPDAVGDPTKLYPLLSQKLNEAGLSREATKVAVMGTDEITKFQKTQAEINKTKAAINKEKMSNLALAKQELKNAQNLLLEDPNNPILKKDVAEFQAAVDKLTTDTLSTDKLMASAMVELTDPNTTPDQKIKAQNTINTLAAAKIGKGAFYDSTTNSIKYLEGSEKWVEKVNEFNKAVSNASSGSASVSTVIESVDEALALVSPATTGLAGAATKNLPQSQAFALKETIDNIIANIGFDRLQQMRDQSKTGGALGQVAVRELDLLQKTIKSLNQSLDEDTLRKNLNAVKQRYESALQAFNEYVENSQKWIQAGGDYNNPPATLDEFKAFLGKNNDKLPQTSKTPTPSVEELLKKDNLPYEPDKFDYRITNGKVQRKAK